MIQVVPFTGTLANTGEHGDTAVLLCDVVDHFHEDNGLAHTGAAEQTHLAALREGNEQVYDLDAGFRSSTEVFCSTKLPGLRGGWADIFQP